eukprot:TRINITY_DN12207_c0_g2_i1.p1 TRINITY_DN12207_c0_g2~~TRINITY_DN12207_c0_g2_i1.p1  ORF type:complete len:309 (-),score=33.31 TRINITY_DN12207_c0_g2_i1:21-863(-)
MEDPEGIKIPTSITDLPEECISMILSFTSIKDVCRSAAVSNLFFSVATSDIVWNKFLPPEGQCERILSLASVPVTYASKMKLFFRLCDPLPVDDGSKLIWLERPTGKIAHMLSAGALFIVWGKDSRYWDWETRPESRFGGCAVLKDVCWLDIQGRVDCKLLSANTTYNVSFMIQFKERSYGWNRVPVKLTVRLPDGDVMESDILLDESGPERNGSPMMLTPLPCTQDGWFSLIAGEFTVEADWLEDNFVLPKYVEFSMSEWDSGRWKSGLVLDGARIEPK